jgi:hypothetical protein
MHCLYFLYSPFIHAWAHRCMVCCACSAMISSDCINRSTYATFLWLLQLTSRSSEMSSSKYIPGCPVCCINSPHWVDSIGYGVVTIENINACADTANDLSKRCKLIDQLNEKVQQSMHPYMNTIKNAWMHTYACIRTLNTCILARINLYKHAYMHAHVQTYLHTC